MISDLIGLAVEPIERPRWSIIAAKGRLIEVKIVPQTLARDFFGKTYCTVNVLASYLRWGLKVLH